MKIPRIAFALENTDETYLKQSEKTVKSHKKAVFTIAACFVLIVTCGIILHFVKDNTKPNPSVTEEYKYNVLITSNAIEWPWEYKTDYEKFSTVKYNNKKYHSRGNLIEDSFIEKLLGDSQAEGYDIYTYTTKTASFEVYKIHNISEEYLIAVKMNGSYYVYIASDGSSPQTLGDLLSVCGLKETLKFDKFSQNTQNTSKYFVLTEETDIYNFLLQCTDAPLTENNNDITTDGISFTATSEALGIYKKVFTVTEDGYIWTNILDYALIYNIGTQKAQEIINYALKNSEESEAEVYELHLYGKITEMNENYITVDDSVLRYDESRGVTTKVLLNDIKVTRCIEFGNLSIGDIVSVTYRTEALNNTITSAVSIDKGQIAVNNDYTPIEEDTVEAVTQMH